MFMRINRLTIQNFKGAANRVIEFGDTTSIRGDNAAGKTTIPDAFNWLIFNRDSNGNAPGTKAFREKPLDRDGNEIHHLDTLVEAECTLDGQPFNLKRVQREKWAKVRNNPEPVFQGNTSSYWINGVELGANEFKARVAGIASDEVFRLITTLGAFNAMDWQKRRALLISICGIEVDDGLLALPKYEAIANEASMRGLNIDDLKKWLTSERKNINQELLKVPARIDENKRNRPNVTDADERTARYDAEDAQKSLETVERMIAEADAKDADKARRERIATLTLSINDARQRIGSEWSRRKSELAAAVRTAEITKTASERALKSLIEQGANNAATIEQTRKRIDEARDAYKAEYGKAFAPPTTPDTCPACGQQIPESQRAEAIEKAKAAFMAEKKRAIAAITDEGNTLKARLAALEAEAQSIRDANGQASMAFDDARRAHTEALAAEQKHPIVPDYSGDPALAEMEAELAALNEVAPGTENTKKAELVIRKADLLARIERARAMIQRCETAKETDKRIKELEAQQTDLGRKAADIDVLIGLAEQFISERCGYLEEAINAKFPTVRWKLFDRQINGTIVDTCECMIPAEGSLVTYSGTNTAAQVNADIEIICALSEHYDVIAPVFVDNAERVNYITRPRGQLITMSVSTDPELVIESK